MKKYEILNGNALKIIALISMIIDHVGVMLFPYELWLRCLGRISLPIFAYMVAEGCQYTRNMKKYFLRIKNNEAWLGNGMGRWISGFIVPEGYDLYGSEARIEDGKRIVATNNCLWLTNIEHGRRHQALELMTMQDNLKYSKHGEIRKLGYLKYDNYDAIDVPYTDAIPSDYDGFMGVPITFLDKFNPEQFEIIDTNPHFFSTCAITAPRRCVRTFCVPCASPTGNSSSSTPS